MTRNRKITPPLTEYRNIYRPVSRLKRNQLFFAFKTRRLWNKQFSEEASRKLLVKFLTLLHTEKNIFVRSMPSQNRFTFYFKLYNRAPLVDGLSGTSSKMRSHSFWQENTACLSLSSAPTLIQSCLCFIYVN